jgi:hypothetical protein
MLYPGQTDHGLQNPTNSHENNGIPVPDPREAYQAPGDPWGMVFDEFKSRDENMAKEYREEIDTLLVVVRYPQSCILISLLILVTFRPVSSQPY